MLVDWRDLSLIRKILVILMICIGTILVVGSWIALWAFEIAWLSWCLSIAALCMLIPAFFIGRMDHV